MKMIPGTEMASWSRAYPPEKGVTAAMRDAVTAIHESYPGHTVAEIEISYVPLAAHMGTTKSILAIANARLDKDPEF